MPLKPGSNPYKILELEKGCTDKEIQKAYRAQCLKWHPDKNLDNKEEAERRFIEAKEAFDFLFDKEKRAEYDKGAEKKRVAEEKHRQRMEKADGARKRMLEDLERREKEYSEAQKLAAKRKKQQEMDYREEIEAMRKQLEREANEEVKRQMEMMRSAREGHQKTREGPTPKLRLKWKVGDEKDYSEDDIRTIFSNYGNIANITPVLVKKEKRTVMIEFEAGTDAWGAELETGNDSMPKLKGDWVEKPSEDRKQETTKNGKTSENGKTNTGNNFEEMSLEELEAHILGDI